MVYYPCCCSQNTCDNCLINIDIEITGATAKACSASVNRTVAGFGFATPSLGSNTETYIGVFTCGGNVTINDFSSYSTAYVLNGSCSTRNSAYTDCYVDDDGYLWVRIRADNYNTIASPQQLWEYYWYFKSPNLLSSYDVGSAITMTYDSVRKTGTAGSDPGLAAMPYDAETATVVVTPNSCCFNCVDGNVDQMQVVVASVTNNGTCTNCPSINGTYVCDAKVIQTSGSFASDCIWQYTHNFTSNPSCSGGTYRSMLVTVAAQPGGTNVFFIVRLQFYGSADLGGSLLGEMEWFTSETRADKFDCLSFSSLSLARSYNSSICNYASSTCHITAL